MFSRGCWVSYICVSAHISLGMPIPRVLSFHAQYSSRLLDSSSPFLILVFYGVHMCCCEFQMLLLVERKIEGI